MYLEAYNGAMSMQNPIDSEIVSFQNVDKYFGTVKALSSVTMSFRRGQVHGLLGPNGSGKTTLINLLVGQLTEDHGRVFWHQSNKDGFNKPRIGHLPDTPPIYPELNLKQYLEFCLQINGQYWDLSESYIKTVVKLLKLEDLLEQPLGKCSRGQIQRAAIAQAVIHRPELIILDEPMLGLDPESTYEFRALIEYLAKESTLILSGHVLSEMEKICTHLSFLRMGEVLETIELANWKDKNNRALNLSFHDQEFTQAVDRLENWSKNNSLSTMEACAENSTILLKSDNDWNLGQTKSLLDYLIGEGIYPSEFHFKENNLEQYYFENIHL
jgi:ABC-2 type transport system ATP-binding protein